MRRHIGVGASDRNQPVRFAVRQCSQRIAARDMERYRWRAVVQIFKAERQRGGERLYPIVSADRAEAARGREGKARGAVGLKHRWGIHGDLLQASWEPPGSDRAKCQENAADPIRRQGWISN